MEFEYGCQTANKYMFLDENEVEDPSDLLAQVAKKEEAPVAQKGKTAQKGAKGADAKGKTGSAKDAKKQPLQQQTDNSVKPTGRQQKPGQKPQSAGGAQPPKEDKENTSNRPAGGSARTGERRPPRAEGDRPDRPPRREGQQDRPDRPPRRFNRPPQQEGGEQPAGEEGALADEGERRPQRGPGGFRHGRGGFRGNNRRPYNPEGGLRDFDRHSGSDKT